MLTDYQIRHMVNRFLGWRLPEGFRPDGGVRFEPVINAGTAHEHRYEPVGTNLLSATQAEAMVRYLIVGMPARCVMCDNGDGHLRHACPST